MAELTSAGSENPAAREEQVSPEESMAPESMRPEQSIPRAEIGVGETAGTTDSALADATKQPSALSIESRAFTVAVVTMVAVTVTCLWIFFGRRFPLSGSCSVGQWSSILAAATSALIFAFGYIKSFTLPSSQWLRKNALARKILDTSALSFAHAAIAFMLAQAIFFIFQQAFAGLTLDPLAGSLFVGLSCALCAYTVMLSSFNVNTYSLSNLLAMFLVTGALTAMITTDIPSWWQINFSILGTTENGLAAYAFNTTLILSGLVIVTLSSYITRDVQYWAEITGNTRTRYRALQWSLIILGVLLSCVGLVPVDVSIPLHNVSATGMIAAFGVIVAGIHVWIPDFPKTFFVTSYVLLAAVGLAILLFWPLGYYNLTGLELASAALVFGWLIVFVRNLAALVVDTRTVSTG